MRFGRLGMVLVVAVVLIVFGLPMMSYGGVQANSDKLVIDVHAQCSAAKVTSYAVTFTDHQGFKQSYLSYVGSYWNGVVRPGASVSSYPAVEIQIIDQTTSHRIVPLAYFECAYGQAWEHSFNVSVDAGQHVAIIIQFYSAASSSIVPAGWFTYIVPGVTT